jgi:hypothetical protein
MKSARLLISVAAVVLFATAAFANSSSDPTIIVKDPICSGGCTPVGTSFTFGTPASGLGTLVFQNASGVNWVNLQLTEIGVPAGLITCMAPGTFASCTVSTIHGVTTIFLSGLKGDDEDDEGLRGIPAGSTFTITFGCGEGKGPRCGPWPDDLDFTAKANVAEPATMALFLTGLAGIATRRKWLKRS